MAERRFGNWADGAALVMAVVPPLLLARATLLHTVNVPWKDHWGHVPFIAEAVRGVITPARLWEQINEHRVPTARLIQGVLAWASAWDVRWEVYADLGFALATVGVMTLAVWRTIRPTAPRAAPWVVLLVSLLHCSLGQGDNWIWGAMMPAYLAALITATLAWLVARHDGSGRSALLVCAVGVTGALSFGSGLALLGVVPLALALTPSALPFRGRVQQAALTIAIGGVILGWYLVGWHPRVDEPPPVFHPDRLGAYLQFFLAYLGRPTGATQVEVAVRWGVGLLAVLGGGSVWLWIMAPVERRAVVVWWVPALYALVTGVLTAFGRLDNGMHVAGAVRYLPTTTFLLSSTAAIAALTIADLWRRTAVAGGSALLGAVVALGLFLPPYVRFAREGLVRMEALERRLLAGVQCLPGCPDVPDACLLQMCWSASVARGMCPLMKAGQFGPYAPGARL